MASLVGSGSEEARLFLAAAINEEVMAEPVKLPKMLRKIPMLYRVTGSLVFKLVLVLDDSDCMVDVEAMLLYGLSAEGHRVLTKSQVPQNS